MNNRKDLKEIPIAATHRTISYTPANTFVASIPEAICLRNRSSISYIKISQSVQSLRNSLLKLLYPNNTVNFKQTPQIPYNAIHSSR